MAHIGFGSTYTYSEADGIDESLFYISNMAEDGKVFLHAHTKSLFIKGNNYVRKIKFPVNNIPLHIGQVIEINKKTYLAVVGDTYYYIKNDSVTRFGKLLMGSLKVLKYKGHIIAINRDYIFQLVGDSLVCKYSCPKANDFQVELYMDSVFNIWQVKLFKSKTEFYKVIGPVAPEFQFSIKTPLNFEINDTIKLLNPVPVTLLSAGDNLFSTPAEVMMYGNIKTGARYHLINPENSFSSLVSMHDKNEKHYVHHADKIMNQNFFDTVTNSFYFGTYKKPFRFFPYIKKYPSIYNGSTASGINAIVQDSLGRIWAGSFEGRLSIIDRNGVKDYNEDGLLFINGAQASKKYVYLNTEKKEFRLAQYDLTGRKKRIPTPDLFVYYTYSSKDKKRLYFGTGPETGLYFTDVSSLDSGNPVWQIIDSTKGIRLRSMTTITEDLKGRIWMGNPLRGFAVYDPKTDKAQTWLIARNETSCGFWSSYTDDKGTVWLGSDKNGLMFFDDYSTESINQQSIKRINHPLLPDGIKVMQLAQWGKWLIIGSGKDMLVMDLEEWHRTKKVFIRYLNPQEGNFTAPPEQNTILIDKRDSSVWFATSDMLYQWDIKRWLSLPTFGVQPNLVFQKKTGDTILTEHKIFKVKPINNTLKFSVWFQSRDNLPRYMSVGLIRKGDSLLFSVPSLQTKFDYPNLAPGNYELVIQICQSDGSVSIHHYPIRINMFWWQHWWVWVGFSMLLFVPIGLMIISSNKARLAEEKARRKDAELETIKAEQQKKLSNMQVVSLSNQFRPHFILNALNTIGAELDNKPQAESVLSRLGESIDLIFKHAQQQKITHLLADEWRLVKNVIDIHQLMYLKNLETKLPSEEEINRLSYIHMPLGLMQIPVENALLHGLSNRETGPWQLFIEILETENEVKISITDNGVGRIKAATLSNYRKHGTGTKNLNGILNIVNAAKNDKIIINYEVGVFSKDNEVYGTRVSIVIPINFQYET